MQEFIAAWGILILGVCALLIVIAFIVWSILDSYKTWGVDKAYIRRTRVKGAS